MRLPDEVVALALSDVHLSLNPPLARCEESDWLKAMAKVWQRVKVLAKECGNVPILCAGDLFDKPYASPELINWCLDTLPILYAIPGNHDLPGHRPDQEHRSAYGCLVRAGRIVQLGSSPTLAGSLALYGKPFGGKTPKKVPHHCDALGLLHVLLTHEYLWIPGHSYTGAPKESRLGKRAKRLSRFDVVVVGDNHKGFLRILQDGTRVVNCGTLMRRKSDEALYRPRVWKIMRTGKVRPHYLPLRKEVITALVNQEEEDRSEVEGFIEGLSLLEPSSLSFREMVERVMRKRKTAANVREAITEAMNEKP